MRELAMRYRLPLRLVYRYIAALEMGGVPLVVDGNRYRILPGWIDRIARTP
jgi:predicted DNA-binding transcriptional regulator YafY